MFTFKCLLYDENKTNWSSVFNLYLSVSRQDGAKRKSSLEMLTPKATPLRPILRLGSELLLDTQKAVVFGYTLRTR